MSLPPPSLGKSLSSPPPQPHSPITSTPASTPSFDNSARRQIQLSGVPISSSTAAPRKGQASRKQHRNQKRPAVGSGGGGRHHNSNFQFDDEDAMAEIRALRNASSRRGQTSITHLLNYATPSRTYLESTYRHYGSGHHSYRSHHHNSAVDKARFVHANYRFVVSPTGNYAAQATDADEYLNWGDVLQVLASAQSQSSSCPICLSEPVAPRMAKCGHIFCLPCLIRFMNASTDTDEPANHRPRNTSSHPVDNSSTSRNAAGAVTSFGEKRAKWKKCPICEESIYLADVRPVRFYAGQESPLPRPGEDVVLRLMTRHANSTIALPREGGGDILNAGVAKGGGGSGGIPWHFAANVLDYSRIMRGTGDYMVEQFDRELEELASQEKEDELLFHEDGEWTQRAMKAVRAAQEKAQELGGLEVALLDTTNKYDHGGASNRPGKLPVGAEPASPTPTVQRTIQPKVDDQHPHQAASAQQDFFFYMSPPHLYLSPLDIRILKTKYGSFSAFPSTLLPRVEHLSTGHVVDDAMRRRAKYLGHLPLGCVVSFLECDWTDIVPAETLAAFANDIERRRKRNHDKAAQEERERLQAERLDAAAIHRGSRRVVDGGSGASNGNGDGFSQAVDINDFQPLGDADPALMSSSASPPNPRTGFTHLASMSTTPPSTAGAAGRTVWGTPAVPTSPSLQAYEQHQHDTDVDDGWLKDDQVLDSLLIGGDGNGDAALAAQMEALGVEGAAAVDEGAAAATAGGASSKKKKKKQKITLMSTGGRRGN